MHKNAQKFGLKLEAKFPSTTLGYSTVRIARHDDAQSRSQSLRSP